MFKSYSNLPLAIWLLAGMTFVNRCGSMVLVFLPLYLTQKMGLSVTTIGLILSLYGVGEIVGSYIGGGITDRANYTVTQFSFLMITGCLYFLLGLAHSTYLLTTYVFLIGFFTAGLRPANGANLARYAPPQVLTRAYALNYQGSNLGFCIGSVIGGILATYNYSYLFIVDGGTCLIAGILFWLAFNKRKPYVATEFDKQSAPTHQPLHIGFLLCFLFFVLLNGFCFSLTGNVYPVFLKTIYQLSEHQIGLIFGLNGFLIILFQMQLTAFFSQYRALSLIAAGSLVMGMGYLVLPLFNSYGNAAFSMLLITIGEMISMPVIFSYINKISPANARGKYLGLCSAALVSIPTTLSPIIGTYVYNDYSPLTLWVSIFGVALFLFFGALTLQQFTDPITNEVKDKKTAPAALA